MPRSKSKHYLVFISHSGPDTWVARRLAESVQRCGAKAFLDEAEIKIGADFEEDILASLDTANEMLVLLTPWSLERPYVWAELGAAWGRRLPIVALLLGVSAKELQTRPGVPIFLKKRDLIELNDVELYLRELKPRVASFNRKKK